ncbi:BadF/BadG/BcrA/BcrD ATPase family protein [Polycladidibacter hongkongensis]|uniref:BadF/BadG/BcrA/BcrD ATPase family protein n=1 Tax=Polycladidibacter hongkongensis TaxID=1647556 RepID=UPI000834154F|nr:BadF/BadG/BcrA/BcrD ATPase family protein [Pseudovibrio hongkongensis]
MSDSQTYLLGIDGGGSGCRAALAQANGALLATASAGPANIVSDQAGALAAIRFCAQEALAQAGIDQRALANCYAVLGLAGVNVLTAAQKQSLAAQLPFGRSLFVSDALVALEGAHGPNDGIIAILGTGSALLRREADECQLMGGWGFTAGDQASGARMSLAVLEATLLAHDGLRPHSALTETMLARFGNNAEELATFTRRASPKEIAALMPLILPFAEQKDPLVIEVLQQHADYLARAITTLSKNSALPVAMLGSISCFLAPYLPQELQDRLLTPKGDAVAGALSLAKRCLLGTDKGAHP